MGLKLFIFLFSIYQPQQSSLQLPLFVVEGEFVFHFNLFSGKLSFPNEVGLHGLLLG